MDEENLFEIILEAETRNWIMTCGSGDQGPSAGGDQKFVMSMGASGLVSSHAYSLLSGHLLYDKNNQPIKLCKLRNPWGQKE